MAEFVEFIDCGSLSISYDATGKASVSLTVVKDSSNPLRYTYTNRRWGGVQFDLLVMNSSQKPIIGSRGWYEWGVSMEGIGN